MTSNIKTYPTLTITQAKNAGYNVDLTDPYLPDEYHLMEGVIADMKRGKIDYALVTETEDPHAICVYRKTNSFGPR